MTAAEQDAARRWLRGMSTAAVGDPVGIRNAQAVYKWARRMGLPARIAHPRSLRATGALSHTGRRAYNARNFKRTAA